MNIRKSDITMHSWTVEGRPEMTMGCASKGKRLIICVERHEFERTMDKLAYYSKFPDARIHDFDEISITLV